MSLKTVIDAPLHEAQLREYFGLLVNSFFKILPMKENNEESLSVYMKSLQSELLGGKSFVLVLLGNPYYLRLIFILQYLIDTPDCPVSDVKREVFRAISICNGLRDCCIAREV